MARHVDAIHMVERAVLTDQNGEMFDRRAGRCMPMVLVSFMSAVMFMILMAELSVYTALAPTTPALSPATNKDVPSLTEIADQPSRSAYGGENGAN